MKTAGKNAVKVGLSFVSLKAKLIAGGIIILVVFLFILIAGIIQSIVGGAGENSNQGGDFITIPPGSLQLSEAVEQYRSDVEFYAEKYEIETYVDVLLAMMMQESGGRGNDPFQASESKCGSVGCIKDPMESIEQGVKYFSQVLRNAEGDIKLALQSYNFGGGFINYVLEKGESYSKDIAIEFSAMKYEELKHTGIYSCIHPEYVNVGACYGDVNYVDNVLRYYQPKSAEVIEGIGSDIVAGTEGDLNAILTEMQKYDGREYVFGGDNPQIGFDCSGLMQWAFKQVGISLPRTAQQQYDFSQKISRNDVKKGDFVFFEGTYNAGVPVTHVGIYIGDNKMYNSNGSGVGVTSLDNPYWSSKIYAFGRVADF